MFNIFLFKEYFADSEKEAPKSLGVKDFGWVFLESGVFEFIKARDSERFNDLVIQESSCTKVHKKAGSLFSRRQSFPFLFCDKW